MGERAGTRVVFELSVETEADGAVLGGLVERIGVGAGTLAMVEARRILLQRTVKTHRSS